MKREDALKISDDVMRALLQMFQSSVGAAGGGVQEDAFVAVGTLVEGELLKRNSIYNIIFILFYNMINYIYLYYYIFI